MDKEELEGLRQREIILNTPPESEEELKARLESEELKANLVSLISAEADIPMQAADVLLRLSSMLGNIGSYQWTLADTIEFGKALKVEREAGVVAMKAGLPIPSPNDIIDRVTEQVILPKYADEHKEEVLATVDKISRPKRS